MILFIRYLAAALLVGALSFSAHAQQQPDPKLEAYRFLLSEANDRVAQANAQVSQLQQQIQALQAEMSKLKAPKDEKK